MLSAATALFYTLWEAGDKIFEQYGQIYLPEKFNLTLLNSTVDLHHLLGHLNTLHFTHSVFHMILNYVF